MYSVSFVLLLHTVHSTKSVCTKLSPTPGLIWADTVNMGLNDFYSPLAAQFLVFMSLSFIHREGSRHMSSSRCPTRFQVLNRMTDFHTISNELRPGYSNALPNFVLLQRRRGGHCWGSSSDLGAVCDFEVFLANVTTRWPRGSFSLRFGWYPIA